MDYQHEVQITCSVEDEIEENDGFYWVDSVDTSRSDNCIVKNYKTAKHLKTYSSHGQKRGQLLDPHGIASSAAASSPRFTSVIDDDGVICVTDPMKNSLTVFKESTFRALPNNREVRSSISTVKECSFASVFDVTVHEASRSALVSDPLGKCLHCVSIDNIDDNKNGGIIIDESQHGYQRNRTSHGFFDETISLPNCDSLAGLCVTNEGLIGVLDSDSGRVLVCDGQGVVRHTFGEEGHNQGQFCLPQFICWDERNKRFLVSDTANARVQAFTVDGRFIFTFDNNGGRGGGCPFEYPSGVTTDDHGRIFVVDQGTHLLQIFDKDGQWLHTLGNRSSGKSCFNSPKSLALLTNGDIMVTDNLNCRLQIFG